MIDNNRGTWKLEVEVDDWDPEVTKLSHYAISGNRRVHIDWTPYDHMSEQDFALWLHAGRPSALDVCDTLGKEVIAPINSKTLREYIAFKSGHVDEDYLSTAPMVDEDEEEYLARRDRAIKRAIAARNKQKRTTNEMSPPAKFYEDSRSSDIQGWGEYNPAERVFNMIKKRMGSSNLIRYLIRDAIRELLHDDHFQVEQQRARLTDTEELITKYIDWHNETYGPKTESRRSRQHQHMMERAAEPNFKIGDRVTYKLSGVLKYTNVCEIIKGPYLYKDCKVVDLRDTTTLKEHKQVSVRKIDKVVGEGWLSKAAAAATALVPAVASARGGGGGGAGGRSSSSGGFRSSESPPTRVTASRPISQTHSAPHAAPHSTSSGHSVDQQHWSDWWNMIWLSMLNNMDSHHESVVPNKRALRENSSLTTITIDANGNVTTNGNATNTFTQNGNLIVNGANGVTVTIDTNGIITTSGNTPVNQPGGPSVQVNNGVTTISTGQGGTTVNIDANGNITTSGSNQGQKGQTFTKGNQTTTIFNEAKKRSNPARSPYAVGMALAKKEAGIKRTHDIPKKVIARAHEIAGAIESGPVAEKMAMAENTCARIQLQRKKLVQAFNEHKQAFARRVMEGKETDMFNIGYGIKGEQLLNQINRVTVAESKANRNLNNVMQESIAAYMHHQEKINDYRLLSETKNQTPYGVIFTNTQGIRESKFFETRRLRNYWMQLNENLKNPIVVEPDHFSCAIKQVKSRKG